ncbi:hypothetical protein OZN62_13275 [Aurantiacibacter sp. MUD11]|uniref:hypothetical protein n=1 Tax=Aurantiacibacter sp. MUD11 TaxID=3003265 RepID=UPI0022AA2B29|nr:hypothetical protein [Aurantiacibacter sp. MUD11]WAT17868.1 hypothetical protein OZN62_13275 [Aurantiacibacter sp. MUD11]
MTESRLIKPNQELLARLHAACRPASERSAISLRAGKPGELDHVLETPENVAREEQAPRKGDYRPEEA